MAVLKILLYPDPLLRKNSKVVKNFNDTELDPLIKDMAETMYRAPGIGLAANQIGHLLRIAVIDYGWPGSLKEEERKGKRNLLIFFNPIVVSKNSPILFEEGCLSLPGITAQLKRFNQVTVEYQDRKGNFHTLQTEGLLAIVIQHEIDHLDGKLYIDHLSPLKKEFLIKKFKKLQKEAANVPPQL